MIETVEELIEVYSLDKEIKDTNPVYKDFVLKIFGVYCLLKQAIFRLPMPNDNVKTDSLNVTEKKPVEKKEIKQPSNTQQPEKVQRPAVTENKYVPDIKKECPVKNTNIENERANIKTTTNNKINERTTTINIVQNAYANGTEDSDGNGCSAINNININFGNND